MPNEALIQQLEDLAPHEMLDLVKQVEEKWGVSATPLVIGTTILDEAPKEVIQQTYNVVLKSFNEAKMAVIKEVRAITKYGLAETKAFVEGCITKTVVIAEGLPKAEAEAMKAQLEAVGATIELK